MADYAISNVPRRVVYAASGTGPYAFTFEILSQTDIAVYKASTLLTLTTDYTVTINANGTGSVTLVATAGTDNITIVGAKNIQRTTDFTTGGDLFANTLNDELDNQTIFIQQVAETAERALKAPVTDPTDIAMTLPAKTDRASKYLGFDSNGNPVATSGTGTTVVSTAMEPVVSAATLAAGRTNFGLGSIATQAASAVAITGGSITGITDLAIADGGTGASTAAAARTNLGLDNLGGMKNRIINGAMVIDQRNAGASITANDDTFAVDRFKTAASQSSKLTAQQNAGSVTPPVGFSKYLGYTSSSAYSITSSDYFTIQQGIEGFNMADLNWGTANAKTITLSFWVRSSLTGTFGGSLRNASADRSYPFTYTINAANTWEYETITIAGDTSGTWGATNGGGIYLGIGLGVGSTLSGTAGAWAGSNFRSATGATSVVGTNGATFYITGVQLEVGTQATSFEYRQYGTELALCQRYCWKYGGVATQYLNGPGLYSDGNTIIFGSIPNPVPMRIGASLTVVGSPRVAVNGANSAGWTPTLSGPGGDLNSWISMDKASHGLTAGVTTNIYIPTTSDYFLFTAEL
jgi:hypothetical protein